MFMKPINTFLSLLCLFALSCEEIVPKGAPFVIGETTDFYFDIPRSDMDSEYQVVFDVLEQDSRCPANYNCVWAGIGIITLKVTYEDETSEITLATNDWETYTQKVTEVGLSFTLVALEPFPQGDELASSKNYVAKVLVESADQ